jgi:uncharacterized protein YciI
MAATGAPAETRPRETVFLLVCHDAPGSARPREAHMRGHLAFIERHIDRILVAGPALAEGGAIDASVFVVRAADEAGARALLAGDPYFQNGVWAQVEARRFRAVCGSALGGITWDPVGS